MSLETHLRVSPKSEMDLFWVGLRQNTDFVSWPELLVRAARSGEWKWDSKCGLQRRDGKCHVLVRLNFSQVLVARTFEDGCLAIARAVRDLRLCADGAVHVTHHVYAGSLQKTCDLRATVAKALEEGMDVGYDPEVTPALQWKPSCSLTAELYPTGKMRLKVRGSDPLPDEEILRISETLRRLSG